MKHFSRVWFIAACSALLVFTGAAFAATQSELQAATQRIEQFLEGLQTLEASFTQLLTDRSGQTLEESSGVLAIRRPDRFRWDYREPYEQTIVADGSRIWLYDHDLEQVTVRKLDETLAGTPAMLLSGRGKLTDNFTVTEATTDGAVQWVRMEPRREDTDFKWVRLGFEGNVLRYMQLADKLGQTTELEFSKVERNAPLDPSRFTFTVPPGADVIGDASSTGDSATQR
jgi:outer membrane lipoprotein carrier protein